VEIDKMMPDHPMKKKAIELANKCRELTHENTTLKEDLKKLNEWSDGAKRLLENYIKMIIDKDDRSYKIEQELNSAKAEINRIKSIEVTNRHNG
jgi:uncharacterized coiled-coil DUF342 family protein